MKESLLKLAKMLAENEKFLKEFLSKQSVEEQYDFAQKSVPGYTKEEFISFLDELEKSYELKRDISPEEMEKVSGGADVRTKAAAMAMLALTAAGGISNLASMPISTSAMQSATKMTPEDFNAQYARLGVKKYLDRNQDIMKKLEYFNCSDMDTSKNGELGRNQLTDYITSICCSMGEKNEFIKDLENFSEQDDFTYFRFPGWIWTGWKFYIKSEKIAEFKKSARSGNVRAKVALWLQEMFGNRYLYYDKLGSRKWGLTTDKKFTSFDDMFTQFQEKYSEVAKEDYDKAVEGLMQEVNLHRALRGALAANDMKVEANAVMVKA